jgi:hypothetical protein
VEEVTRRTMLSLAQRVFDPIGFTCLISHSPKLLLQNCWEKKGEWDQEVPEDVRNDFLLWLRELPLLEEIKIRRWLRVIEERVVNSRYIHFVMRIKQHTMYMFLSARNTIHEYKFSWYKTNLECHRLSS